jgi:hypothetical protein
MSNENLIGITERGDPSIDLSWMPWVQGGRPAVLITKNPSSICDLLQTLSNRNVIVHATITGHGGTTIEPGVVGSENAFSGYLDLVKFLGSERVVLRVDPIIPTAAGIWVASKIVEQAVTRVRISFLDNYDHVKERFIRNDLEPLPYSFHAPLAWRYKAWDELGRPEVCSEPDLPSSGCISEKDCDILGVVSACNTRTQRRLCRCVGNKYELLSSRHPCTHGCLYCYWKD